MQLINFLALPLILVAILSADAASPPIDGVPPPVRREVYDNGRVYDVTHRVMPDLPKFESAEGVSQLLRLVQSIDNGSRWNEGEINGMGTHTGTHVDTPGHFYQEYYEAGYDIDSLDLGTLNGPAMVVDVPRDSNITADVMKSLQIPKGTKRVLFRTLNTDRRLMFQKEFDSSYVGFMTDGAQWLVDNTDIKLVGLDYLSVAAFVDVVPTHRVFLKNREIIIIEAMKLDGVEAGMYNVHCLPLRLAGAEASPARCILIK